MFGQVNDLVILFGISLLKSRRERAGEILQENETIIDAIGAGDSALSARLMEAHITRGHDSFRAMLAGDRPALRIG